jgi:hypothetical protein
VNRSLHRVARHRRQQVLRLARPVRQGELATEWRWSDRPGWGQRSHPDRCYETVIGRRCRANQGTSPGGRISSFPSTPVRPRSPGVPSQAPAPRCHPGKTRH